MRKLASKLFPHISVATESSDNYASLSHMLLQRKRLVDRCYNGAVTLNPYILRSVHKLEALIDRYMESIGGQRIMMPSLSPAKLWQKTGRWDSIGDELFKIKDRSDNEYCLAPTHEETVCSLIANHQHISYKALPLLLYQITNKFRDEPRPKGGLLRGKEFIMKDMYSFDEDELSAQDTYCKVVNSYESLFKTLSLDIKKVTADSGNIGGSTSHEFHVAAAAGEDTIQLCMSCGHAINSELFVKQDDTICKVCESRELNTIRGIELAHTFLLGTRYSQPLHVQYTNKSNKKQFAVMGCYGIGVTRLLAASIEVLSTEDRLRFPKVIAPYLAIIIPQKKGYRSDETYAAAESLYDSITNLQRTNRDVVLDDRLDLSIGHRIHLAKQMGYPYALCVGKPALTDGLIELLDLYDDSKKPTLITAEQVCNKLESKLQGND